MTHPSVTVEQRKVRPLRAWVEWLPRLGYLIRGLIYVVVGMLALGIALGLGGPFPDQRGAIAAISDYGAAKVLLGVIALGLFGYSLWGFARAILDPLGRGTTAKGIAERIGFAVSGLAYGALIFPTVRLILGAGRAGDEGGPARWTTAWLLAQPLGPWIVALVGVIATIGGLGQFYLAYTAGFKKDFKNDEMSDGALLWATRIGRFGHIARGVVFSMFGIFIIRAALFSDADEVRGLDGTLQSLAQQAYGPWLLGFVALGLIFFGVFSTLSARWISIIPSNHKQAQPDH